MTTIEIVFGSVWLFIFLSVILSNFIWKDKSPKSENDDLWDQI